MDKAGRYKLIGILSLCLFLVPLLGWLTGLYVESRYESQFRDMVVNKEKYLTAEEFQARGLTYVSFCRSLRAEKSGSDTEKFCSFSDEIEYAQLSAIGTAAIGVLLFILILGGRAIAGTNRARMSLIFGPLIRIVMLLLAVSVLAQGGLFVYSAYTLEVAAIQRVHGVLLLAIGLGAIATCWVLLKYSVAFLKIQPMLLRATPLDKERHKSFFYFVNGIASKLKARPPENIVVGIEPNFFVTASDVKLLGTDQLLRGRTLFVSLGLLHLFDAEELASVVGHELGHFRGGDVAYTMKFAPIYSRLSQALGSLGQSTGNSAADLGKLPAMVALSMCLMEFASAERTVGRERELVADQAGAEAASAHALARALVKVSLFAPHWTGLTNLHASELAEGRTYTNLAQTYASVCTHLTKDLDWGAVRESLGAFVQAHPVDTHPPLAQRLQNLQIKVSDISPQQLAAPERPAIMLISEVQQIEEGLSTLEAQWLVATGAAVLPDAPALQ